MIAYGLHIHEWTRYHQLRQTISSYLRNRKVYTQILADNNINAIGLQIKW